CVYVSVVGGSGMAASTPAERASGRSRQAERRGGVRVRLIHKLQAADVLVFLPDRLRRARQDGHAAEETAIGLVVVRHRAEALPSVATQLVQAAVVAGARVRVGGHGLTGLERAF